MSVAENEGDGSPSGEPVVEEDQAVRDALALLTVRPPAVELRVLMRKGLSKPDALSLIASAYGLPLIDENGKPFAWKLPEISKLLFLVEMVRTGKIT